MRTGTYQDFFSSVVVVELFALAWEAVVEVAPAAAEDVVVAAAVVVVVPPGLQ